jgi:hypothetical protein
MVAFGTTEPEGSVTVPTTVAVWADAKNGTPTTKAQSRRKLRRFPYLAAKARLLAYGAIKNLMVFHPLAVNVGFETFLQLPVTLTTGGFYLYSWNVVKKILRAGYRFPEFRNRRVPAPDAILLICGGCRWQVINSHPVASIRGF